MEREQFETTFESNGKTYTVYQFAEIENVYMMSDGSVHGDFNTMSASSGFIFSDDFDFEEFFAIWGFETVLKMESELENENFNLIK